MANLMNGKKVELELVGLDGNAFSLMGAFKQAARRQGFKEEEYKPVLDECLKGDYDHLLCTLMEHCKSPGEEDDLACINDTEDLGENDSDSMYPDF